MTEALRTRLEPLEVACGMALGPVRARPGRLPRPPGRAGAGAARRVLEDLVLDALRRGGVSVSFSGGRDSSLVLAVAVAVARREGLPDPLPVTIRHPSPASREDHHQEVVVRHLGLREWARVDVGDTMDVLGEEATGLLVRHGLLAPPNAYLHLPMVAAARPGTLLTGSGGDQLLGTPSWRVAQVLARRRAPRAGDLARLAFAAAPRSVRRATVRHRERFSLPWLRPAATAEFADRLAADWVAARVRWDVQAMAWCTGRGQALATHALDLVAGPGGRIASPLADPAFVAAFCREVGMAGPVSRDDATRMLAGDLLPADVVTRRSKATFDGLLWGPRSREFAAAWDPATLDPRVAALVDTEALGRTWRSGSPHFGSLLLLQRAWLDQRSA